MSRSRRNVDLPRWILRGNIKGLRGVSALKAKFQRQCRAALNREARKGEEAMLAQPRKIKNFWWIWW